jgi:hypothetical protein
MTFKLVLSALLWTPFGAASGVGIVMLFAGICQLMEGHVYEFPTALVMGTAIGAIVGQKKKRRVGVPRIRENPIECVAR